MKLVENIPLDTHIVANLFSHPGDLHLVWPLAKYPFDHEQWREVLSPETGNKSFLVYEGNELIGHAALRKTSEPQFYSVSFLYLIPQMRSKGLGTQLLALLEEYAKKYLCARGLTLVVRTYNPRAFKVYTKCGFQEYSREGTLIRMSKIFQDD